MLCLWNPFDFDVSWLAPVAPGWEFIILFGCITRLPAQAVSQLCKKDVTNSQRGAHLQVVPCSCRAAGLVIVSPFIQQKQSSISPGYPTEQYNMDLWWRRGLPSHVHPPLYPHDSREKNEILWRRGGACGARKRGLPPSQPNREGSTCLLSAF